MTTLTRSPVRISSELLDLRDLQIDEALYHIDEDSELFVLGSARAGTALTRHPRPADTHFWKQAVVWAPVGSVAAGTVVEQS